jgi:hypothetical protein
VILLSRPDGTNIHVWALKDMLGIREMRKKQPLWHPSLCILLLLFSGVSSYVVGKVEENAGMLLSKKTTSWSIHNFHVQHAVLLQTFTFFCNAS